MNLLELSKKLSQNQEKLCNINSMIILEPEDPFKETVVSEYFDANNKNRSDNLVNFNFGIKYNIYFSQNNKKNTQNFCEVYKLKKSELLIELLKICLSNIKSSQVTLVIVIDLGKLDNLVEIFEFLEELRKILNGKIGKNLKENVNYSEMLFQCKNENKSVIVNAFPIPLMVIGCNFAKFLELDDQSRRVVQQLIRHFCLINFAQLYFLNEKSEYSIHMCKLLIHHLAFERNPEDILRLNQIDKSLLIFFGQDKLEDIYSNMKIKSWDDILQLFRNQFKQKEKECAKSFPEKNRIDSFSEPDIDYIYNFNMQKLEFRQFPPNN